MSNRGIGPRSEQASAEARAGRSRADDSEVRAQEAALDTLRVDIQTLENQKKLISRLMLETLTGYESVLRRVKSSGDRTLARGTAENLKALGSIYQGLARMNMVPPAEREFLKDYVVGLHEAANNLAAGQQKVDRLLRKSSQQQRVLAQMQQRLASMGRLQVEESLFFDAPDKRAAIRRTREIDRKLHR